MQSHTSQLLISAWLHSYFRTRCETRVIVIASGWMQQVDGCRVQRDIRPFQENTGLKGYLLMMEQGLVSFSGMDTVKSEKECNR